MRASRRAVLAGALAAPAAAGLPSLAWGRSSGAVLVYDPSLAAGRRLADAQGGEGLAIAGDRIRFAQAVFARRPAYVVGISRPADALLIEEVASEAGYAHADATTVSNLTAAARPMDRGLVLAWVLAPLG